MRTHKYTFLPPLWNRSFSELSFWNTRSSGIPEFLWNTSSQNISNTISVDAWVSSWKSVCNEIHLSCVKEDKFEEACQRKPSFLCMSPEHNARDRTCPRWQEHSILVQLVVIENITIGEVSKTFSNFFNDLNPGELLDSNFPILGSVNRKHLKTPQNDVNEIVAIKFPKKHKSRQDRPDSPPPPLSTVRSRSFLASRPSVF